jgi:hypothetical protein
MAGGTTGPTCGTPPWGIISEAMLGVWLFSPSKRLNRSVQFTFPIPPKTCVAQGERPEAAGGWEERLRSR